MNPFDEDLIEVWRILNRNGVRYVMIGGVAANLHGYIRSTSDADFYFDDTPENRERIAKTFEEMSIAPFDLMMRYQFVPGWAKLSTQHGVQLDMMTDIKGMEAFSFDDCYRMAVLADIEGIHVPYLHLDHLLLSKQATNRPKDQLDILELKRLEELRKLLQ